MQAVGCPLAGYRTLRRLFISRAEVVAGPRSRDLRMSRVASASAIFIVPKPTMNDEPESSLVVPAPASSLCMPPYYASLGDYDDTTS